MEETKYFEKVESPYQSVKLECKRCNYKWTFAGSKLSHLSKYPVYAQCPNCRTSVKVEFKEKKKEEGTKT